MVSSMPATRLERNSWAAKAALLAAVLAVAMMLGIGVPGQAWAASDAGLKAGSAAAGPTTVSTSAAKSFTYKGLRCWQTDGGLRVEPAKKTAKSVAVPATIKGQKVIEFYHSDGYNESTHSFNPLKLKKIDLKQATNLKSIVIYGTQISSIDLTKCKNLENVDLQDNSRLKTVKFGSHPKLTRIQCMECGVKKLNVTKCPKLKELWCGNDLQLSSLNLTKNTKLTELYAWCCNLKKLNLSKNTNLRELECSQNKLASLNLSKCKKLTYVACANNELANIQLPATNKLKTLTVFNNKLKTLDLRKCPKVNDLQCWDNANLTSVLLSASHVKFKNLDYHNTSIADASALDARYSG